MLVEGYTTDTPERDKSRFEAHFTLKHGYKAIEYQCRLFLGEVYLVKLGPVYRTSRIPRENIQAGDCMLLDGIWHTIALVDCGEVLTESDMLITLPEYVRVRL